MNKNFKHTIDVIEGVDILYIVDLVNKDLKDYKEINLSLRTVITVLGYDEESYNSLQKDGIFPRKELIFKTWIPLDLYNDLKANGGLEIKADICPN